MAVCTYEAIECFNAASKRATDADAGCSICQDTLGIPESKSPANLSMIVLENCKHQFHEICLMEWLGPIVLPRPAEELDPVVSILEDGERHNYIRTLRLHHLLYTHQRALEIRATGANRVLTRAGRLLRVSRAAIEGIEESAVREEPQATSGASEGTPINTPDRDPEPQALPDVDSQKCQQITHRVAFSEIRGVGATPTCPHCRQPANINNESCHADSLQLIRVRLRLANLAYQCFGFTEHPHETLERQGIQQFLHRRFLDNIFLSAEPIPTPENCRRLFKQARILLRDDATRYIRHNKLYAHEVIRVMQLAMFYENFALRDEHIKYFFDADAR
ncbi:MAG: hypothetical protein Q9200_004649, partial [Gallowayella weberi]